MSYLELGRASYSEIKRMAAFVSRDDIRPILERREYLRWRPLSILLLAQDPNIADRELIEDSFRACQRFSLVSNLAAWATAYIEISGERAIDEIVANYLRNPQRETAEVTAVVAALSVHGLNGRDEIWSRIVEGYRVALRIHPGVAGTLASDLTRWERWELRREIGEILSNERYSFSASDERLMQKYLSPAGFSVSN